MDAYDVLGVDEDAGEDEVKQAYAEKTKETHPEHGGSKEEFHRVREAYETLMERRGFTGGSGGTENDPGCGDIQLEEGERGDAEVVKWLRYGFRILKNEDLDYCVHHPDEDVYVDEMGRPASDPVWFTGELEARTAYARFLKHLKNRVVEGDEEADEHGRWSSSETVEKLDGFWRIMKQELEPWGEDVRWTVYCPDQRRYVEGDGSLSKTAVWFSSREDAASAYERHRDEVDDVSWPVDVGLTAIYTVFVLPLKIVEAIVSVLLKIFGREPPTEVPWIAEGVVIAAFAALLLAGYGVVGVLLAMQFVAALVYWGSPYEPEGSMARPRWKRRNTEVRSYDPDLGDGGFRS